MKFRIHYEVNGHEDSVIVTGDTLEEIRDVANREIAGRGATNAWSEELPISCGLDLRSPVHSQGGGGPR